MASFPTRVLQAVSGGDTTGDGVSDADLPSTSEILARRHDTERVPGGNSVPSLPESWRSRGLRRAF